MSYINLACFFSTKTMRIRKSILGIVWENTTPNTEFPLTFGPGSVRCSSALYLFNISSLFSLIMFLVVSSFLHCRCSFHKYFDCSHTRVCVCLHISINDASCTTLYICGLGLHDNKMHCTSWGMTIVCK